MPKAAPSSRVSNEVTLVIGPRRLAITIYSGTDSNHGVKRQEWLPVPVLDAKGKPKFAQTIVDGKKQKVQLFEDHKVGRGVIDKDTGELLDYAQQAQVEKKMETENGLVWITDAEIETLFTIQPDTLVVRAFQPLALFAGREHYVPSKPMCIGVGRDKKKQPLKDVTKLLGGLLAVMAEDGLLAVCELTTRGLPKPCVLFPDGQLWQIYHTDALREPRPVAHTPLSKEGIAAVRQQMVTDLRVDEPLDLSDTRADLIRAFAEEKAAAGDFSLAADTYVKAEAPEQSDEDDILALLGLSVEAAKAAKAS